MSELEEEVLAIAAHLNLDPERNLGLDALWPLLEAIRNDGGVVVIKLDGERSPQFGDNGVYTVVLSSGSLFDDFFRRDSDDLRQTLLESIAYYAERAGWND